ncbi:MAG: ATP-dependent Clp protease proteolytic subunit [Flavobacteriales bacterium TMED191]|nr:MAG: ATP-dependent Clp protease proteolytic subunit [Flavobacteriales bacterium TMED191]|tara:strand:+ start:5915 stop:6604 length:690 start_codon:yes stop_codon:yes gene_type:complete
MTKRVSGVPKKKDKKKKISPPKEEEKQIVIVNNIQSPVNQESELRAINLYGDITEQKGADVVAALLYLENTSHSPMIEDPTDPESTPIIVARSIAMMVSTHGGTASDMFSILDIMDMVKKRTCDIETYGVGKVMSAGVPILAAGTKGKRKVGRNCRIMLHNVMAGTGGTIFSMENELEEIKWIQERYIETLANYTKLTPTKIKKLLKTQKDVYISAEEAIKMGIADEII